MEVLPILMVLGLWLGFIFFFGFMWWKIMEKTGYHGALGLLMLVPIANIIMMAILAFKDWPSQKEAGDGAAKTSAPLSAPIIAVIAIATLFPIMALLAAIAIPNFLRARLSVNEHVAEATVKSIASAIESYAVANSGKYPSEEFSLIHATPPYLKGAYNNKTIQGYEYSLNLNPDGYEIVAKPSKCGVSASKIFKMKTNTSISEESCSTQK